MEAKKSDGVAYGIVLGFMLVILSFSSWCSSIIFWIAAAVILVYNEIIKANLDVLTPSDEHFYHFTYIWSNIFRSSVLIVFVFGLIAVAFLDPIMPAGRASTRMVIMALAIKYIASDFLCDHTWWLVLSRYCVIGTKRLLCLKGRLY